DRLKATPHVVRHILLRVPEIQVTWTALEINHDHIFSHAPARTAGFFQRLGCLRLKFQEGAERKAQHSRAADTQEVAPGHFQVRIAKVTACTTGYFEHNF